MGFLKRTQIQTLGYFDFYTMEGVGEGEDGFKLNDQDGIFLGH